MADLTEFWQHQHQVNSGWLTGTSFESIKKFYDVGTEDFQGRDCLEIGVGRATVSRSLATLAHRFYCCDISDKALEKVSGLATETFLSKDVHKIPAVDVVLCHLVFVHCDDLECIRILKSVNLNPGARVFCQFSCFDDPVTGAADATARIREILDLGTKHFFRKTETIQEIIQTAGLHIYKEKTHRPGSFHGWNAQHWQFYELQKQTKGIEHG